MLGENLESASYPDCWDNKDEHQEKILIRHGVKAPPAGPGEVSQQRKGVERQSGVGWVCKTQNKRGKNTFKDMRPVQTC